MGMKAGPASQLVVETLGLEGQLTGEQFLRDRELILHKTFSSANLMPGDILGGLAITKQVQCTLADGDKQHSCSISIMTALSPGASNRAGTLQAFSMRCYLSKPCHPMLPQA